VSTVRRALTALALASCLLAGAPAAVAACPKTSVADVEDEVMCPVCGTPLSLAVEAPQARRQREFILQRVERCQSKDEIKAALAAEFGDDVLATPGDEGFDRAAYVVPLLVLLGAAGTIAVAGVRWRRRRVAASAAAESEAALAPADARRLDADLERYRA
jgi:cytochrome c-type biogenesis protein CcmH